MESGSSRHYRLFRDAGRIGVRHMGRKPFFHDGRRVAFTGWGGETCSFSSNLLTTKGKTCKLSSKNCLLLFEGAGPYLLIALAVFMTGVIVTVVLIRNRKKETGQGKEGSKREQAKNESYDSKCCKFDGNMVY